MRPSEGARAHDEDSMPKALCRIRLVRLWLTQISIPILLAIWRANAGKRSASRSITHCTDFVAPLNDQSLVQRVEIGKNGIRPV